MTVKSIRTLVATIFAIIALTAQANAACFEWSKTASSNANADATINWAEGMAPSAVNDSARAMMARLAECRDDTNGALTTGGTSTAYTVTTNQGLGGSTPPDGFRLVLRMSATNGASPTLAADGGTAFPIRTSTGTAIGDGYMVAGGIYAFSFNSSTSAWMVNSFFSIPVNLDLIGTTQGSVLYRGASQWAALTPGSSGTVLTSNGSAANPSWQVVAAKVTPQGYLTGVSGTVYTTSDVTSATAIYYAPDVGNLIPIYDGTNFINTTFSQLTITLSTSQAANTIYDVCVFNDSGTIRGGFTPAWQTSTAGSGSRGTGAGTPQLTKLEGLWVNAVQVTVNNGSSTYVVPASRCTYVGSILTDGTAGRVSALTSYGTSRKFNIWNAYNKKTITLKVGDSTASWNYTTATYRQSRSSSANQGSVFVGLAEETVNIHFNQNINASNTNRDTTKVLRIGIGVNSTTTASGFSSAFGFGAGSLTDPGYFATAQHSFRPAIGLHNINTLEYAGGVAADFLGTESNMLMTIDWRG